MSILLHLHHHHYRLRSITPDLLPDNTLLFVSEETATDTQEVEFTFDFHFVGQLPAIPNDPKTPEAPFTPVFSRHNICIWQHGPLQRRQISVNSPHDAYAIYEETSATHADIWFLESLREELRVDTIFISTLSLERHLAPHGIYIFHCAYMLHHHRAILLSGPSGAGKSTHAELWHRHVEGTRVINGDRGLICREPDGSFVVDGWPVCGSSGICHNETHPLGAIVFIEQTPDNRVIAENLPQHYRRVFAQLTINHWDAAATNAAADWIMSLCTAIPIVTYGCNMAPDAPYPLHDFLNRHFISAGK